MNVDTQLKRLDAAQSIPDDLVLEERARQTLTAILGQEVAPGGFVAPRSRRRALRYAVAVGAVVVGGVLVTDFLGGSTAYASWTATAHLANPIEEAKWGGDCLSRWSGHGYTVRLVELRGRYAFTVLAGNDGYEATCLMEDQGPNREVIGGGYEGSLKQNPPPAGLVTNSVRAQSDDDGHAAFSVTGRAGPHVAAVTIEGDGVNVTATLKDGYFAAWWPGATSMIPRGGPVNPRVTITLTDGSTRTGHLQDFDVSPL